MIHSPRLTVSPVVNIVSIEICIVLLNFEKYLKMGTDGRTDNMCETIITTSRGYMVGRVDQKGFSFYVWSKQDEWREAVFWQICDTFFPWKVDNIQVGTLATLQESRNIHHFTIPLAACIVLRCKTWNTSSVSKRV